MITAIQNIASGYNRLRPGIRLRINDISIEWGGLFDTMNDWILHPDTTHGEHRVGRSADVGTSGLNRVGTCVNINRALLLGFINRFTTDVVFPHNDHYHARMR